MRGEYVWLSWGQYRALFSGGDPYQREKPSTATSRERHRMMMEHTPLSEVARTTRDRSRSDDLELFLDPPSVRARVEQWRLEEEPEEPAASVERVAQPAPKHVRPSTEPLPWSRPLEPPLPVSRPGSGFRRAGVAHLEGLDLAKPAEKKEA